MAVDHIEPEDEGDAEAGFVYGGLLKLFDGIGGVGVEDGADLAAAHFAIDIFTEYGSGYVEPDGEEVELADFFFKGHFGHELINKTVHFIICRGCRENGRGKNEKH